MNHLKQNAHPCQPFWRSRSRPYRKPFLMLLALPCLLLTCVSCSESKPSPPRDAVTDTRPIGQGLKIIGFAMIGAAVVGVLGRMIK